MSGRILSRATDIEARARAAAAASGLKFRHVMYSRVSAVRDNPDLDVFVEPLDDDAAHANFVAYRVPMAQELTPGHRPKMSQDFVRAVVMLFDVCDASDITPLERLRQ